MNEPKPEGFQPAPWETGKPKPPQGYPPQPGAAPAHPPRPAAPGYGAQPPAGPPPGAGFGGGDMGRGRTRQVPGPTPQATPPIYGAPPAGYGAPQPAYPPQGQPYPPQGQPYPPQGQPYPQPGQPYPQPMGAPMGQPYGAQPYPIPAGRPTSVLAILSLVAIGVGLVGGLFTFGIFSLPFFLAGAVLGYLGMRETAAWGKKSGRGMAVGGTIANTVLLTLNVIAGVFLLIAFQATSSAVDSLETNMNASMDGTLIQERVRMYAEAKGDLKPGGPQFKQGFQNTTAVTGAQLQVTDLVSPTELKNPIEQYSLTIADKSATVWWTSPEGQRMEVGQYPSYGGYYADDFEDWESYEPPPRRK